jgi:hypothetical protein
MNPDSHLRNSFCHCWFEEETDTQRLQKAIQLLVRQNDIFRISIREIEGEFRQFFKPFEKIRVDYLDFKDDPEGYKDFVNKKLRTPLPGDRPFYFSIIRFPDHRTGMFLGVNHVIGDGTSIVRIIQKIHGYYAGIGEAGNKYQPEETSFLHAVESETAYLRSDAFGEHRSYWHEKFDEIPGASMAIREPESFEALEQVFYIGSELEEKIKQFCSIHEIRFYNFFISMFCLFWSRIHQSNDYALGTLSHGRYDEKMMKMVGMFANTLALRINKETTDVNGFEWIREVSREYSETLQHDRYPYDVLIRELKQKNPGLKELFNVMVNYQRVNYPIPTERFFNNLDEYELAFNAYVVGKEKGFQIKIQYQTAIYSED